MTRWRLANASETQLFVFSHPDGSFQLKSYTSAASGGPTTLSIAKRGQARLSLQDLFLGLVGAAVLGSRVCRC